MSVSDWIAVICFGLFALVSARQLTRQARDHGPTVTVGSALLVFDVLVGCAGVAFVVAGIDEAYWPLALALLARVATQRLFELRNADAETDPTAGRRP